MKYFLELNNLSGRRQNLSNILPGILLVGLFFFLPSQASVPAQDQTAIIIEQENSLIGSITVTACQSAIKITERLGGLTLISKSPDWRVTVFNTQTKKIFSTPLKQYAAAKGNGTQNIFTAFHGLRVCDVPLEKCEPGTFLNFPVHKYKATESFQKRMQELRRQKTINGSTPANVDFQTLNLPVYGPEVSNILARTTGCAETNQLPIQLTYTGTDNKNYKWLATTSLKKAHLDDKVFTAPSGYKTVKSEAEISESKVTTESAIDLFDMRYVH